jgi:hypothetical protein
VNNAPIQVERGSWGLFYIFIILLHWRIDQLPGDSNQIPPKYKAQALQLELTWSLCWNIPFWWQIISVLNTSNSIYFYLTSCNVSVFIRHITCVGIAQSVRWLATSWTNSVLFLSGNSIFVPCIASGWSQGPIRPLATWNCSSAGSSTAAASRWPFSI